MRVVKIVLAAVAALRRCSSSSVAIFAATFDPNDYKGVVTDAFTARTGRTLTIDEDLRLAYFPWLAVETGGVTIGSAAAFGGAAQPFATARRVAARVKLLPLLSRRVEVGTVELEGLTLNLARDASLTRQLAGPRRGGERRRAGQPGRGPAAASGDDLAIEGVRISDGNVYWRENTNELRYSVTDLSLTTGGIGSGEPVDFDAALNFADETSGLKAALTASAVVAAAANGAVTATDVEASVTRRRRQRRARAHARSDGHAHRVRSRRRNARRRRPRDRDRGHSRRVATRGHRAAREPDAARQRRRRLGRARDGVRATAAVAARFARRERARHVHARRAVQLANGAAESCAVATSTPSCSACASAAKAR